MNCSTPGFPVLQNLLELAQTHAHWVSDAIQPSQSPSPPSPALSLSQHHGLFQWISQSTGASVSASVHPVNIQGWFPLGLISFSTGLISFLSKGQSLLQHYSSKVSILWPSAFFMVQLSHPYMSTWKTTALNIQSFASKMISLLFNMLSRFVIAFLPRRKCL